MIKMLPAESVSKFMTRVKMAAEHLASYDVEVTERDQCHTVIDGLTESFSGMVNSIDLLQSAQLTWPFLTGILLQEELKHNQQDQNESLMLGLIQSKTIQKRQYTFCKRDGHTADYCWHNPSRSQFGKGPGRNRFSNTNRQYESAQLMIVDRKESQHYLYMTHNEFLRLQSLDS